MSEKKIEDLKAEEFRLQRNEYLKDLPQFHLLDRVKVTGWFCEWREWQVFAESEAPIVSQWEFWLWNNTVCTEYTIVFRDKEWLIIDRKNVETKYLELIKE